MKKPRFGRDDPGPTREELEKEAARELERMTRQSGGPSPSGTATGWSSATPTPASSPPSYQPRFGGGASLAPEQPSVRERFAARDNEGEEDDEGDYSEEEIVTELALRDWSERSGRGRSIEDLAMPRLDPRSVEAQRDRALREFTERQARMERESEADRIRRQAMGLNPQSRASTVNLTAARPMGMLNLSAQAAGMRGQGSGGSVAARFSKPESEPGSKPAAKKAPAQAARKGVGAPAAKGAKKAQKGVGAAVVKNTTKPATEAVAKGNAKPTTKAVAKSTAKPATKAVARSTAKPATKAVARSTAKPATKAVAKSSTKPTAKAAGKVAGQPMPKVGGTASAKGATRAATNPPTKAATKATAAAAPRGATRSTPTAVTKAKKSPAAAKATPAPRKGSGRR